MRIYDLVGGIRGQRAGHRVAVIGTCRVYGAFEALEASGRVLPVWSNIGTITHTLQEAGQLLRHTRGELEITGPMRALIFNADPVRAASDARMLDSIDTVFVEVSDQRQISHEAFYLNGNRFYDNFISKYGAPMLPWYRALIASRIDDDLVASVMEKLADRSDEERQWIETILSRTRMKLSQDVDAAASVLDEVMFDRRKQWVLVSQFLVPGVGGTHMDDRARSNDIVQEIGARKGLAVFNPSELVARHGPKVALASEGRDIYHYNPAFNETVADGLLGAAGLVDGTSAASAPVTGGPNPADDTQSATRINDSLVRLHERRVALGVNESGLYAHYKSLLDQKSIVGRDVTMTANLIANHLPKFDHYHVLRAGLGELAFVLASLGLPATGYDPNGPRFGAMSAGLEQLYEDHPELVRRVTIGRATIPIPPSQGRTLAVARHLSGFNRAAEDKALSDLSTYSAVLIKPSIFLYGQNSEAEQDRLLARLQAVGFKEARLVVRDLVYCAKSNGEG